MPASATAAADAIAIDRSGWRGSLSVGAALVAALGSALGSALGTAVAAAATAFGSVAAGAGEGGA